MNTYRQFTTCFCVSFFLLTAPVIATAVPITYQFDAFDWENESQTFSGTITFESSTVGVSSYLSTDPNYPGFFVYEDAIISITLDYGITTDTMLGGDIYNNCTFDPYFSIISSAVFFDISMPSCLPGADQAELSFLDLTVLNSVISYPDPALYHRQVGTGPYPVFSGIAHPYNFRLVTPVSEPAVFILIAFGIATMGLIRRKKHQI